MATDDTDHHGHGARPIAPCTDDRPSTLLSMSCPRNDRPTACTMVELEVKSTVISLLQQISTTTSSYHDNPEILLGLLLKIRKTLSALTPLQQKETFGKASMEPVFSCLKLKSQGASSNPMNREMFELIGLILTQMLNSLEPSVVLNQFRDEIYGGVAHPDETIRTVCLKQVERFSKCKSAVKMLHSDADMIAMIISRVGDDNLSVAQVASSTLLDVMFSTDNRVLQLLFSGSYLFHINSVVTKGDIFRYRIFEIVTKVATHSSNALLIVARSGLLQDLVLDLTNKDKLIQMNAIEMLSNLATCKHGLQYMDKHGILNTVEDILIAKEVDHLMIPTLFKFFCSIAKFEPKRIMSLSNSFFKRTLDVLCSDDTTLQASAIDVVAVVGSSVVGKEVLHKQGLLMIETLEQLGKLIQQSPMELRVCTLMGLASLFSSKNAEQTSNSMSILEEWFMHVTSDLLQTVISISKQPFPEVKCAAFSVLQAIANQEWAQKRMNRFGGFHEYLLDRSSEHDQTCRISKFHVIKALADSAETEQIFGKPFLLRLKEYVKDGPLHINVQSEVALRL